MSGPEDISYGSEKKVKWKCKDGHEWEATVCSRTLGETGCPYCSGNKTSDKNRFSIIFPELLKEWDYSKNKINPNSISVCSIENVYWKCKKGHHWRATVCSRTHGCGCPFCANQKVDNSNCIATTHPNLAREWHPTKNGKLTPCNVVIGSQRDISWECSECGYVWLATPFERGKGHKQCLRCRSLGTVNPRLAREWHPTKNNGITPYDILPCINRSFWWECEMGHEWGATVHTRSKGYGCPICGKIYLKDGTSWDSQTEAYVYLKFKNRGFDIETHKKYGGKGGSRCDFYFPKYNLYYEVTSFNKNSMPSVPGFWKNYMKKMYRKRRMVVKKLKANFRFLPMKRLNKMQRIYVTKEMA